MTKKIYNTCAVCGLRKDEDQFSVCLSCYNEAQHIALKDLESEESVKLNKGIKEKMEDENGQE